jgi:trans-AT polyketide synthase/acyltransferase/oxidoreductase domain-containing protein
MTTTTQATTWWTQDNGQIHQDRPAIAEALRQVSHPLAVLDSQPFAVGTGGQLTMGRQPGGEARPVRAMASALPPEQLGDAAFKTAHGLRFAYVQGDMANGIASEALVEAVSTSGGIGFFGAAGLSPARVEKALDRLSKSVGERPYGSNLIHSPNEPVLEDTIVSLYLDKGMHRACAAAFLGLTLPLVRYRVTGIHRNAEGRVITPNMVFAKVSRTEVAEKFLAPPPAKMLAELCNQGVITPEQAEMAATIPMAEDITAEADSGGHTDNRPALCLIPTLIALRDQLQDKYCYAVTPRVGAAGGIATPQSVCAAFAMGASYVLTGTVNQACIESGTSDLVRQMLAEARQADVAMAPAADMFEMGVNVQVLKRGTMFPIRAKKLYELYRRYDSIEALPANELSMIERDYLRCTAAEEWANTRSFFLGRDPKQVERAEKDAKHKMALIFRSYLGRASGWANAGVADRKVDYQVWCGPAMGAFNEWTRGSFLELQENRKAVTVAHNLMLGAAVLTRVNWLRNQGVVLDPKLQQFAPLPPEELIKYLGAQA